MLNSVSKKGEGGLQFNFRTVVAIMRFAKYGISPYMLLITVDEMSSRRTREFDNEFISNF